MIFDLTELEKVGSDQFKPVRKALESDAKLKIEKLLSKPEQFFLAMRTCDGIYHKVNSEISEIFKNVRGKIRKSAILDIAAKLSLDENIHGQRFIIINSQCGAYLLGDVLTALKQLAK